MPRCIFTLPCAPYLRLTAPKARCASALLSKKFDLVMSSITITPERKAANSHPA